MGSMPNSRQNSGMATAAPMEPSDTYLVGTASVINTARATRAASGLYCKATAKSNSNSLTAMEMNQARNMTKNAAGIHKRNDELSLCVIISRDQRSKSLGSQEPTNQHDADNALTCITKKCKNTCGFTSVSRTLVVPMFPDPSLRMSS